MAVYLIANPRVVRLVEQTKVTFGKRQRHYIDFIVTWQSGKRSAYAVKYSTDVAPSGIEHTLAAIREATGNRYADEFCYLTEDHVTLAQIANAFLVIECAKDLDGEASAAVQIALRSLPRLVSLAEIEEAVGLGHRGFRAAIAMLKSGALSITQEEELNLGAILLNSLAAS